MANVFSLITPKNATAFITDNTSLRGIIERFKVQRFSVVPIIGEDGKYVGTISEGDLLRYIASKDSFKIEDAESMSINDIEIYRPYKCLSSDAALLEIMALALEQNFIPIIDDRGFYIGIIKRKEILEFLFEQKLDK